MVGLIANDRCIQLKFTLISRDENERMKKCLLSFPFDEYSVDGGHREKELGITPSCGVCISVMLVFQFHATDVFFYGVKLLSNQKRAKQQQN